MLKHRSYRIALGVSILFHLLLLLLYKPLAGLSGLIDFAKAEESPEEPLTFELVDSYEQPQELVETPEDARVDSPPEDARFLSDKNAQAQDMLDNDLVPNGLSFSEGISEFKTFAGGGALGDPSLSQSEQFDQEELNGEADPGNDERPQEGEDFYSSGDVPLLSQSLLSQQKKFSKQVLRGTTNPAAPSAGPFSDDADWNNQQSNADALGGISLSTYQWNYAPYLLYMKRRIREHLYPPTAFVQMGAISGDVTISFVLRRDGAVRDLKFVGNRGHNSFIDPSLNSIKASAPFKPLPDNFPDPYLELTWTFVYTVYR